MDVIKIVTPEAKPSEFAMQVMDVSGIQRKFLDIPYVTDAVKNQTLDIYLPDEGDGPFPTIVFIHGGAFWGGDKQDTQPLYVMDGIRRGYAVVSINHRLSNEAKYPLPVYDCKAAIRFLRANAAQYCLDPKRFATAGDSAGGYFATILGTTAGNPAFSDPSMGNADVDERVQAVIGLFGVYDLAMQSQFTEDSPATNGMKMPNFADIFAGVTCRDYPELMHLTWPGAYVTKDCPPMLIQAGTSDEIVPYQNSPDLVNKINEICGNGRAIMEPFEGRTHGHPDFLLPENIDRLFAYLDSVLK